ncbi:hypothetical protein [Pseudoroseicyclus sp. CXY001]|uniref:hypothetical protein n=1 Tax=Pseudoroseicyclus sp. CXY001 TaxID=3242492 RepID=UPI003570E034
MKKFTSGQKGALVSGPAKIKLNMVQFRALAGQLAGARWRVGGVFDLPAGQEVHLAPAQTVGVAPGKAFQQRAEHAPRPEAQPASASGSGPVPERVAEAEHQAQDEGPATK